MDSTAPAALAIPVSATQRWTQQVRLAVAVLAFWAVLTYAVQPVAMSGGFSLPRLVTPVAGVFGALLFAAVFLGAALVHRVVAGSGRHTAALTILGAGVVLWTAPGGTMDDWLTRSNTLISPPRAGPYAALLVEYAFWIVLPGAALVIARRGICDPSADDSLERAAAAFRKGDGWLALGATAALGASFVMILAGPAESRTLRGQVWFSVFTAFYAATYVARSMTHVTASLVYWIAPVLVGLGGVIWAMARPAPPGVFGPLNNIVANALVRPLPAELLFVGLLGVIWALRTPDAARRG